MTLSIAFALLEVGFRIVLQCYCLAMDLNSTLWSRFSSGWAPPALGRIPFAWSVFLFPAIAGMDCIDSVDNRVTCRGWDSGRRSILLDLFHGVGGADGKYLAFFI